MKAEQIHLLRKSFEVVRRQRQIAALVFYRRLFELDPSLRALFETPIEQQAHKVIEMLEVIVDLSDKSALLETELRALGVRHKGYGVIEAHYPTVGRAMLDMLADVLGPKWTPSLSATWAEFYQLMAGAMLRGAAENPG
jgi:hemoglobin-like flavoprotein